MNATGIETLFATLVECPPSRRAERLAELDLDDPALAAELRSLLDAADKAQGFLSRSPRPCASTRTEPAAVMPEIIGQHIGPYRVERALGHGGMGTVYLAERADGQYRQQVALKLIQSGFHQKQRIQRFRAERQILAQLTHPYIARLLDGGSLEDGQPYLVMEYIRGEPLDRYCHRNALKTRQRLELFVKVCEAVAHAHGQGVVHRDLKPANILVTADGTPKLLDFGIAKLLAETSGERLTLPGQSPMTPGYAAPEQLHGEVITHAADIYALGLILYELLTGRYPGDEFAEHESEIRKLKGDLDNIIRQALAHSPWHRYASVQALIDDILSYLAHRPVGASGRAPHYRFGKWLYRHRAAAALTGLMTTILFAGGLMAGVIGNPPNPGDRAVTIGPVTQHQEAGPSLIERCARLREDYLNDPRKTLFSQLAYCQLDAAEWYNARGDHLAALETLNTLVELRRQSSFRRLPPVLRAQRDRFLAAFAQARAGSSEAGDTRDLRPLADWPGRDIAIE